MQSPMQGRLRRIRALATPGHAAAAVACLVATYLVWGRVFVPGGTGSNVVLGLLVAVLGFWVGTTSLGPIVDDALAGKEGRVLRQKRREAEAAIRELAAVLRDDAELTKKPRKKAQPLAAADRTRLEQVHAGLEAAAPLNDAAAIEAALQAAHDAVEKAFGPERRAAASFAQARSLAFAFAVAVGLRLFLVAPFQIPSGSMVPTLLIGDHLFVFRASYGLMSPLSSSGPTGNSSYLVRWALPSPGDVVVFEAPPWVPRNAGEDWIKRVVAGAGQKVKRVGQTVYVDGKAYTQSQPPADLTYPDYDEGANRWHKMTASMSTEDVAGHGHLVLTDMPPLTADWPTTTEPRPGARGLSCNAEECTVNPGYVFVMGDNRDHSSDGRYWGAVPVDNIKGRAILIWVSVDGSEESVHLGRFTLPKFNLGRFFRFIV